MRQRWHCWLLQLLPGTISQSTVILYNTILYNIILYNNGVTVCNVILCNVILHNVSVILYNTVTLWSTISDLSSMSKIFKFLILPFLAPESSVNLVKPFKMISGSFGILLNPFCTEGPTQGS